MYANGKETCLIFKLEVNDQLKALKIAQHTQHI